MLIASGRFNDMWAQITDRRVKKGGIVDVMTVRKRGPGCRQDSPPTVCRYPIVVRVLAKSPAFTMVSREMSIRSRIAKLTFSRVTERTRFCNSSSNWKAR